MALIISCRQHKTYQGKRKPTSGCTTCQVLYDIRHPYNRDLADLHIQEVKISKKRKKKSTKKRAGRRFDKYLILTRVPPNGDLLVD